MCELLEECAPLWMQMRMNGVAEWMQGTERATWSTESLRPVDVFSMQLTAELRSNIAPSFLIKGFQSIKGCEQVHHLCKKWGIVGLNDWCNCASEWFFISSPRGPVYNCEWYTVHANHLSTTALTWGLGHDAWVWSRSGVLINVHEQPHVNYKQKYFLAFEISTEIFQPAFASTTSNKLNTPSRSELIWRTCLQTGAYDVEAGGPTCKNNSRHAGTEALDIYLTNQMYKTGTEGLNT